MTCHEGTHGVYRYSTTLSLASALDRGCGYRRAVAALPPIKRPVPAAQKVG